MLFLRYKWQRNQKLWSSTKFCRRAKSHVGDLLCLSTINCRETICSRRPLVLIYNQSQRSHKVEGPVPDSNLTWKRVQLKVVHRRGKFLGHQAFTAQKKGGQGAAFLESVFWRQGVKPSNRTPFGGVQYSPPKSRTLSTLGQGSTVWTDVCLAAFQFQCCQIIDAAVATLPATWTQPAGNVLAESSSFTECVSLGDEPFHARCRYSGLFPAIACSFRAYSHKFSVWSCFFSVSRIRILVSCLYGALVPAICPCLIVLVLFVFLDCHVVA